MPSTTNPSDRRNLDSVATILRQRVTPESRFYALVDVSPDRDPNSPAGGSFDRALPFTARLSRVTDAGQPQIGDMPPQPPTLRARLGAVLVGIVRRMLFWYTEQIRALQKRIAEAAREQAQAFQELSAAERRQRAELVEMTRRLTGQEQHLQQADDRVRELQAAFGGWRESIERQARVLREEQAATARALAVQVDQVRESEQNAAGRFERIEQAHAEIRLELNAMRQYVPDDRLFVEHVRAFRGLRAEIKRRLAVYVPYAQKAYAAAGNAPALDLGCGRGEWLEVLAEAGIPARGIDANRELAGACRELGLDAIEGDVPGLLRSLPDESRSIVTAIHLLEHLSFQDLLEVIDHAVRILKPGGIAIFETPNPANLFVSSHNFYLDPTHRHPLPSEFLTFVVEARGLSEPEVIPLTPYPDSFHLRDADSPAARFINEHFYGPQDYGLVACKPQGPVTRP